MEWGMVAAFWGVSMLFIMSPGADWSYAISAGIHKRVLPSVTGLLFGHVLATLIVAAGLGLVLAPHPPALMVLRLLGAAYLAWMGWKMFRQPATPSAGEQVDDTHWGRWCWKGFCVSGLNPKVLLLFLALLPQLHTSATAPRQQMVFVMKCFIVLLFFDSFSAECPRQRQAVQAQAGCIEHKSHGQRHIVRQFVRKP